MGLNENDDAVLGELFFENQTLQDIKELVEELREYIRRCSHWCKNGDGWKD